MVFKDLVTTVVPFPHFLVFGIYGTKNSDIQYDGNEGKQPSREMLTRKTIGIDDKIVK